MGVGRSDSDAEAVDLMVAAVEAAAADAGSPSLPAAADRVAVPQGTWPYSDPARLVAARIGAAGATTVLARLGGSPTDPRQ